MKLNNAHTINFALAPFFLLMNLCEFSWQCWSHLTSCDGWLIMCKPWPIPTNLYVL
jgi:hypothetical protein